MVFTAIASHTKKITGTFSFWRRTGLKKFASSQAQIGPTLFTALRGWHLEGVKGAGTFLWGIATLD
jgi:hypothetical protein